MRTALVKQLATFALRRVMTIDDHSEIEAIARKSKLDDYKLWTVLENVVLSDLCQKH